MYQLRPSSIEGFGKLRLLMDPAAMINCTDGSIHIQSMNGDTTGPICKGGRNSRSVGLSKNDWSSSGVNIIQNGNGFKFNFDFYFEWELLPGLPGGWPEKIIYETIFQLQISI